MLSLLSSSIIFPANELISKRGQIKPVTPSSTTSGRPPASVATTAFLCAIASSAISPKLSYSCDGTAKMSILLTSKCISSTCPRKYILSLQFSCWARSLSSAVRCGVPEPASKSTARGSFFEPQKMHKKETHGPFSFRN